MPIQYRFISIYPYISIYGVLFDRAPLAKTVPLTRRTSSQIAVGGERPITLTVTDPLHSLFKVRTLPPKATQTNQS